MPDVVLKLKEMFSHRQMAALEVGEIDIALTRLPIDASLFDFECISRETMQLVCSKNHPLAAKPQVYWTDLHDQDLILFDRNDAPHFHELIARHLLHNNITPRVRRSFRRSTPSFRWCAKISAWPSHRRRRLSSTARTSCSARSPRTRRSPSSCILPGARTTGTRWFTGFWTSPARSEPGRQLRLMQFPH